MQTYLKMIDDGLATLKAIGITLPLDLRPENVDQIVADWRITSAGTGKPGSRSLTIGASSVVIRMSHDFDWVAAMRAVGSAVRPFVGTDKDGQALEFKELREDGIVLYSFGPVPALGPGLIYFHVPDPRTIVFHAPLGRKSTAAAYAVLIRNAETARKRDWGTGVAATRDAAMAVVVDNRGGHYADVFAKDFEANHLEQVRDQVRKVSFAAIGIELGEKRPIRAVMDGISAEAMPLVEGHVRAGLLAARDLVDQKWAAGEDQQPAAGENALEEFQIGLMKDLLHSAKLRREGARMELLAYSPRRLNDFVAAYIASSPTGSTASEAKKK
jgi:hypothetical protein